MHNKNTLINDIKNSGIRKNGTLLIHSSMKAIGEVDGGAETVLDAFCEYMSEGLLIFPTHSWDEGHLKNDFYDYKTEPSCVGILTNLFMKRQSTVRSLHPTHSVTAMGKKAREYVSRDENVTTPCPRTGCFGGLYDENAQLLFLGASLKTNTYIHSLEEQLEIPNRIATKPRKLKILQASGSIKEIDYYGHHSTLGDVSKNYDKLLKPMLDMGIAKKAKIGDAVSYVVEVVAMTHWVLGLLRENSALFDDGEPIK